MASMYQKALATLSADKCRTCAGSGKENDLFPGDMYFNEWVCTQCHGTGLTPGSKWDLQLNNTAEKQSDETETAHP